MEDYYDCEPLNLVKKKPKPVAVVAPSAVIEVGDKCKDEEDENEEEEIKVEDLSLGKKENDKDGEKGEVIEDVNKNCFWEKSNMGYHRPEDNHNGLYSMINNLASCEPNLLTSLYMRSLVNIGVLPPGSYMGSGYPLPIYPTAPRQEDPQAAFSPMWAQQRFWQMVQMSEAQKTAVLPPSPQSSTSITDSLSITVPPLGSTLKKGIPALSTVSSKTPESLQDEKISTAKKLKQKRSSSMDHKNSSLNDGKSQDSGHTSNNQDKKKPHIKKPLNAFMLYMKEMRAKVVAECTLKESAAINQILGRRWHALGRDEQAKYYELARRERQLHMQLYPDWSSRANANRGKKRKRKQETNEGGNSMKKCRARYGLDQQSQWCKPCRRKKKCIRYMECGDDGNQSEDNLGSCGSVGEAQSPPDDDGESFQHSLSSPGGLSGLSSLTSPSMILPSPNASLASPSVSLASPCMSLQSPLTPHQLDYECSGKPPVPSCLPLLLNHHLQVVPPHRNPVGTNPHDINNPLSVNQLTGKCIKNSSPGSGSSSATSSSKDSSRPVISVT